MGQKLTSIGGSIILVIILTACNFPYWQKHVLANLNKILPVNVLLKHALFFFSLSLFILVFTSCLLRRGYELYGIVRCGRSSLWMEVGEVVWKVRKLSLIHI